MEDKKTLFLTELKELLAKYDAEYASITLTDVLRFM